MVCTQNGIEYIYPILVPDIIRRRPHKVLTHRLIQHKLKVSDCAQVLALPNLADAWITRFIKTRKLSSRLMPVQQIHIVLADLGKSWEMFDKAYNFIFFIRVFTQKTASY